MMEQYGNYELPCMAKWREAQCALDKYDELPSDFSAEFLLLYSMYTNEGVVEHSRDWRASLLNRKLALNGEVLTQEDWMHIFGLRSQVEGGGMDNLKYAELLWDTYIGKEKRQGPQRAQCFFQFQRDFADGHRHIPSEQLVYPEFKGAAGENMMQQFLLQIAPEIKKVILWSKGDVEATAYQVMKIFCSDILNRVQEIVCMGRAAGIPVEPREGFDFWVTEHKVARLEAYIASIEPEEGATVKRPQRIVVLDDSRKNLAKVQALAKPWVEIVPIWAAYSREGIDTLEKAPGEFVDDVLTLKGVRSPLEIRKYDYLMKDAVVLLDFDGVFVDNVVQRVHQGLVMWASLEAAIQRLQDRGLA